MTGDPQDPISEEAVAWFVLLRDDDVASADREGFAAWLAADPRHRKAWAEVDGLWQGLDALEGPAQVPVQGGATVVPLRRPPLRAAWMRPRLAAAAAILLLIGAAILNVPQLRGPASGLLADHRTGAGETKTVVLPDGSAVILGGSSALSVSYDGAARRISLYQGEVYYAVVPDAARPFVVTAGNGRVTVVGTEFDVKRVGSQIVVSVARGAVDVATEGGGGARLRLAAGQAVRYGDEGIDAVRQVDAANVGAWRAGRLVFQGAPLGEVFRDLDRYRPGQILITDDAIADLPVTGSFDTSRPDAALESIARILPVRLVQITDRLLLVRPVN